MSQYRTQVYQYFQTGDIPTEAQFQYTWNSVWFKDEKFSITDTTGLENALQNKLENSHASDDNAHDEILAKIDASNLNDAQKEAWKQALEVGTIPANVALVDEGEPTDVFNKNQIRTMAMMLADYTIAGKIRADKIEALGLTDLIEASENTLVAFAANSANYEFQKNDFVAIPDLTGNYSLFMFKGGNKLLVGNYLPTGLTKITIAMVEGLQTALDSKMSKPAPNGNYFINSLNGNTSFVGIALATNYLAYWNGTTFSPSDVFRNPTTGLNGIGTKLPTELLHLIGRARMTALVLDENTESLPGQITRSGSRFSGTNTSGIKRGLMYNDYQDTFDLFQNFTPTQSLAISQLLNGGSGSTGSMSVNLISPPIVQNQYNSVEYVMLQGANLNLSAVNRKIEILAADKTTVKVIIPDNQIQTYDNGLSLIFYYNFYNFTEGQYFIRITSGSKIYITTLDLTIVQSVQNIDLSTISWGKMVKPEIEALMPTTLVGGNFTIDSVRSNIIENSPIPNLTIKSNEIFAQGEDFYVEMKVNISYGGYNQPDYAFISNYIGVGYSNAINDFTPLNQIYCNWSWAGDFGNYTVDNNDTSRVYNNAAAPLTLTIVFIKTGNLFRTIINGTNVSKTLSNNSGYAIFLQFCYRKRVATTMQGQITKAFKFN